MRTFSKLTAGALVGFGGLITLSLLLVLFNGNSTPGERDGAIGAMLLFSLPLTVVGGGMFWHNHQRYQQMQRDRIREAFFNLLETHNGQITPLRLSMETKLDGAAARAYLDDRAKEFNASFKVTEDGNLIYSFELGGSNPGRLPS
jgi:predicted transcriptional regulator